MLIYAAYIAWYSVFLTFECEFASWSLGFILFRWN